jgi:DNA-binding transcriptional LysR family regulator
MAADHPLSDYEIVRWSELVKYPQVVFKDGYGMQRLVQEWFSRQNVRLNAVMELNTLDAFRGVVRQGKIVALLPQAALIESRQDPTLAVRPLANFSELSPASISGETLRKSLTREVVMVTTRDRLEIPPIAHFCHLVQTMTQFPTPQLNNKQLIANY